MCHSTPKHSCRKHGEDGAVRTRVLFLSFLQRSSSSSSSKFSLLLFYSLLVVRLRRAKSGTHDDLVRAMKMMNAWYTSEYDFLLLLLIIIIMKIFISSNSLLLKLPRPPPQNAKMCSSDITNFGRLSL